MKYLFIVFCVLFLSNCASSQVVNRYPNIQRPTQTSATIAWRRANNSTGTLYLGSAAGVWFDSVSTVGLDKKHFFDLAGLQANMTYYYQVKSIAPNDTFVSAIESFYTAPLPLEDKLTFLAYGDCGYNNVPQNQVKDLMLQEKHDFALVTGDVDQDNGDNYDDIFFGVYKDILKKNCHFPCIGNHDTYHDAAATYLDAFYLFSNNPANSERYYSFEWGDAKFVCLDANISYAVGSAQFNWMINEFKCNDKKWLFIYFHQPPWTNAWSADYYIPFTPYFNYKGNVDMRTVLVPEFEKYNVDFVVNGHSHCYQRGEMNGVQYVITGGGGASTLDSHTNSNSPNISVEIYENHFVRFDISGDTAKYVMINKNGVRRDSVTVIKPYTHYSQAVSSMDISCHAANDGQVLLSANGPKPPYTYAWNTGATTANLSGLSAGTYMVSIVDFVGCERKDTVVITEPASFTTQVMSNTGELIVCNNTPLTLTATGNYASYLWSTGATTTAIQVTAANTYTVTAYDGLGCSSVPFSVTVTTGAAPSAAAFQQNVTNLNVAFTTSSAGSYLWNFGDGNSSTAQNPSHSYAAAGNYTVQLIVSNSCGSDTTTQLVSVITNIANIEAAKQINLSIQPNPFKDFTIMSFDNEKQENYSLTITDVQGRTLRHYENITTGSVRINKQDLAAGTYLYNLKSENHQVSGQLVVN